MPTVAFVNPKGGAGKTTAALLLALGLAEQGQRVALVDADPNRPLVHWANLPGRPGNVSVHPAPMEVDLPDALREARNRADWVILDTEGTVRSGASFVVAKPDLVLTPLASSVLEALQAVKAAEMVLDGARKLRRPIIHACLLTRLPAALRPKSLRQVVDMLRERGISILPTAIVEKEAFRTLFAHGGGLDALEHEGAHGAQSAHLNATTYALEVMALLKADPSHALRQAEFR